MKKAKLILFLTIVFLLTLTMLACSRECETHEWSSWSVNDYAGCTSTGLQHRHCTECGVEETQEISALGHNDEQIVHLQPATCTDDGLKITYCNRCHQRFETAIPCAGHDAAICDPDCAECRAEWGSGLKLEFDIHESECWVIGIGECADTEIKIPPAYKGLPVTFIKNGAFSDCASLTSITIPNTVTRIDPSTIQSQPQLIQTENGVSYVDKWVIACESTVTSVTLRADTVGIVDKAFASCSALTSITLPNTVMYINNSVFSECTALTSITIPDGVTRIGEYAFNQCTSLTSITIPDSVTTLGTYAFRDCANLTSITIGNGVTSISTEFFSGCTSLHRITVGDGNANYKTVDGNLYSKDGTRFLKCAAGKNGTAFTVPNGVTRIDGTAFEGCTGLISITLPDTLTDIGGNAFAGCTSLSDITIPNAVRFIGIGAFSDCVNLTSITLPEKLESLGTYFGSHLPVFDGCTKLSSITVAEGNPNFQSIDGNLYKNNGTVLLQYAPGKPDTSFAIPSSVTKIESSPFEGCANLTTVTIPDSITEIEKSAFSGCTTLTAVTIPDSITVIGDSAFSGCTGLTTVTIPDSVTKIGGTAFKDCTGLTTVTIPDSVTEVGSSAFEGCTSLTDVTLSNNITKIPYGLFLDCTSLSNITIPNNVTCIELYAFLGCRTLSEVTIPNSATEIGSYLVFEECTNLTTVYYGGTEEDCKKNGLKDRRYKFTVYLYSEEAPAEDAEGSYWRYVDGVPKKW